MGYVDPKNFGTNTVGIVGSQTAFGTPVTALASMDSQIVEFRPPFGLSPAQAFYPAPRLKGSPSPDAFIPGMRSGGGMLNFYIDPRLAARWLSRLFQGTVTSMAFANLAIQAATGLSYTENVGSVDIDMAKEPKTLLAAVTADPVPPTGLRASKLRFTFAGSSIQGSRIVDVRGTDQNGLAVVDRVTLADVSAADGKVGTTRRHFAEDISLTITRANPGGTPPAETLKIDGVTGLYDHSVALKTELGNGLTLEVHEGNSDTPITYSDTYITRGGMMLERVPRLIVGLFSHEFHNRQNIAGGADGTDLDNAHFSRIVPHTIPDWGISFEIVASDFSDMEDVYFVESLSYLCDNMIRPPRTAYAESLKYPKCVRAANRNMGFQCLVDHTKEANFDQMVEADTRFTARISAVSKPAGGAYTGIFFEAAQTQFTGYPRRVSEDLGEVRSALQARFNAGTSGNDEVSFRAITEQATL